MLARYRNKAEKEKFEELLVSDKIIYDSFGMSDEEKNLLGLPNDSSWVKYLRLPREAPKPKKETRAQKTKKVKLLQEMKQKAKEAIRDVKVLNQLIDVDMNNNPSRYINLLKRKVFNPHQCNIASTLSKPYSTMSIDIYCEDYFDYNGNFSLLYAVLTNLVKPDNVTIMECDELYRKFGFSCRPIITTDTQKILARLYEKLKSTLEDRFIFTRLKEEENSSKKKKIYIEKYCRIEVPQLSYNFDESDSPDNLWRTLSLEDIVKVEGIVSINEDKKPKYRSVLDLLAENLDEVNYPGVTNTKWKEYLRDFKKLKLRVLSLGEDFIAYIYLYDMLGLPIDFGKFDTLSKDEEKRLEEIEKRKEKWKNRCKLLDI